MSPHKSRFFVLVIVLLLAASQARAATVNTTQALDFGKWYVTSNSGAQTITIGADGSYSHSGGLTQVRPPREGIYSITGLTPSSAISQIVVTQTQSLQTIGGEQFMMDNFDVDAPPSTDGSGAIPLHLGAVAHTSGNGNGYAPGNYNGVLSIEIDY